METGQQHEEAVVHMQIVDDVLEQELVQAPKQALGQVMGGDNGIAVVLCDVDKADGGDGGANDKVVGGAAYAAAGDAQHAAEDEGARAMVGAAIDADWPKGLVL